MAREGFSRWEWTTLRASDVGAPHGRRRWFCVATYSEGYEQREQAKPYPRSESGGGIRHYGTDEPDASRLNRETFGQYAEAVHRWELITGRIAPDPTVDGRLNPVFVEWMMGLDAGYVTGVEGLSRSQQLKILGNGVVPLQAATALASMMPE